MLNHYYIKDSIMSTENNKDTTRINRIALLYRDLLSSNMRSLSEHDKSILLNLEPINKIIAIGDIDFSNWNAYPLSYFLSNKLVAPTVLDESKIYQSIHGMRTHNENIIHPQALISQSVVIRIIGLDNSAGINDYINTFINMCIASDVCKIIFVIFDGNKKFYKDNIYIRKTNSSFIETSTGKPYTVESSPLCISPDQIVYFGHSKKLKSTKQVITPSVTNISSKKTCSSMLNDPDMF